MSNDTSAALGRIKAALDYKHRHVQLTEAQAREVLAHIAALEARAEKAEYELRRWKEVESNRPNWEKLWASESNRADEAEAKVAAAEDRGLVFNMLPDGRLDFCAIREGSRLWDARVRAEALTAEVARLRSALEKIDGAISAGITETDGPARVKAGGDTRIEDGFIVGQFAIQFELIMKCVQNVCREALAEREKTR